MKLRIQILNLLLIGIILLNINCTSTKNTKSSADTSNISATIVNAPLLDTHWKLVELDGKIIQDTATNKEMYMMLKKVESRVEGDGGCNAFSGTYKLGKNNTITFSQFISTRMWCHGIEYETQFFKMLSTADHYYINGDTLSLTNGKIANVAKFDAIK